MKGAIQADHIPTNKYQLIILGMPPLTPVKVSGLEDELEKITLPDRTVATGGNRKASEFEMEIPMHHTLERITCDLWFQQGQEPVSPSYKRSATLVLISHTGNIVATYSLVGAFIFKRTLPDLEMGGEGEMATITYGVSVDDILPL